jgi:hypothetical protein
MRHEMNQVSIVPQASTKHIIYRSQLAIIHAADKNV